MDIYPGEYCFRTRLSVADHPQEGLFSVLVGLLSFLLVPATPKDSRFLNEREKE